MLLSLLKHHLDLNITDTALKVSQCLYCFTISVSRGVENYFPRLWVTGISDAIFLILCQILLYPQTTVGDILDSGPSRRRRHRRNFLVDAITQKQINIFFSNLVHMLRVPKGRSLF